MCIRDRPIGYGVCFVTIGLVVQLPGISDRAFCLPYAARLWWPWKTKVKPAGGNYKSKSELAVELISLTRSWEDRTLQRFHRQLERQQLVVLDELGYVPFSKAGGELLFEVVKPRL